MSLALFRSTLRNAVRDVLADAPRQTSATEQPARQGRSCAPRHISRLELTVHDGFGGLERAS